MDGQSVDIARGAVDWDEKQLIWGKNKLRFLPEKHIWLTEEKKDWRVL